MPADGRHLIIGTAGHVDHGKSVLVRALTGRDPDSLPEEKARGMTVDLGFVFMPRPLGGRTVVFIDVPGHERLVRTMVAGASSIDAVLLLVAADEGIMPQTREHFQVLELLGVNAGLVVLAKSDLADAACLATRREEIRRLVAGSFLAAAPVIPVSARTGAGLGALEAALAGLAARTLPRAGPGPFRMPLDRVFSVHGFGTVVAGTIRAGEVSAGDRVMLYPEGLEARVRAVQVRGRPVACAGGGCRAALNLPGLDRAILRRGQCLAAPGSLRPASRVDALFTLLQQPGRGLKHRTRLRLHTGAAEVISRLVLLDREWLAPGEAAPVQFFLESPLAVLAGDRFLCRFFSPVRTVGGGMILNADPPCHRRHDPAVAAALARLAAAGRLLEITGPAAGAGYLHAAAAAELAGRLTAAARDYLRDHPYRLTVPFAYLRARALALAGREAFVRVFDGLLGEGVFARRGDDVILCGYRIRLSRREQAAADLVAAVFRDSGFTPPLEADVARESGTAPAVFAGVMSALLAEGVLVRLSGKVVYHRDCLREMETVVRSCLAGDGRVTLAGLRDRLRISRKYTQAVLEYFDAIGLTRRVGDEHRPGGAT